MKILKKRGFSILVFLFVILIIFFLVKQAPKKEIVTIEPTTQKTKEEVSPEQIEETKNIENKTKKKLEKPSKDCLEKFNLTKDTIIFYYSEESHSKAMKPIVKELEKEYRFYWTNNLWNAEFNKCFGLSGSTPSSVSYTHLTLPTTERV